MKLNKVKKVHFTGIGGIGVSAIARIMLKQGIIVTGSDLNSSMVTDDLIKQGAKITLEQVADNIGKDIDLVVYSPAVPEDNPERVAAEKLGIIQKSYPEILGELMADKKHGIAVSGTNGKTTTTAILGLILEQAKLDPTVIVGSNVKCWEGNARLGQSEYMVAEGCEWQAHMLHMNPWAIVLTNIEEDHLDYFRDLDHIIDTFQKYINKLPKDGVLVINNDDQVSREILKKTSCKIITYGINHEAEVMAKNIKIKQGEQQFDLVAQGKDLARITLQVPGVFNIANCLAAAAVALHLGVNKNVIQEAIGQFQGTWRRFERVGEVNGVPIISDYAHHPTAIKGTLTAAKEFYPEKRIFTVFQPHQHNRTKRLFKQFIESFDQADLLIISEIFDVTGREADHDQDISSQDLVEEIKKKNKQVWYAKDLDETKKLILDMIKPGDLLLILGAGDVYKVTEQLA